MHSEESETNSLFLHHSLFCVRILLVRLSVMFCYDLIWMNSNALKMLLFSKINMNFSRNGNSMLDYEIAFKWFCDLEKWLFAGENFESLIWNARRINDSYCDALTLIYRRLYTAIHLYRISSYVGLFVYKTTRLFDFICVLSVQMCELLIFGAIRLEGVRQKTNISMLQLAYSQSTVGLVCGY